ncbi:uncharacterized protein F4812DRAFT_469759 [Daldinia caldariorum]|uniref:uncharacterized protein n=1 Tax=Daldinia caldariorum TaxID=326644 RepID=UPI0020082E0D|nr:uncharacterized protein F4812DRAFT_469759 [Daldinia caldariorum]KAI1469666.1 hypothetical protein F4812DRAFT_469759 [Daldinia caldariorum]
MAHSPLLRTVARFKLDTRSVALVNYELALEDISTNLQLPPDKTNFDDTRWANLRKDYESKTVRSSKKKLYEQEYATLLLKGYKSLQTTRRVPRHYCNLLQTGQDVVPGDMRTLKATLEKSGLTDWKPPASSEGLLFESQPIIYTYGQVSVAETGIIDRRLLHVYLSPKYVPKPHFRMERKRLEAKSAEFAAFVEKQASNPKVPSLIPRPEDDSSDEGLLTMDESSDLEEYYPVRAKGSKAKLGKRKAAAKSKPKKRTRKPTKFVKLYDSKAHDYAHLRAQGVNLYSLVVQRLPRAEVPELEKVYSGLCKMKVTLPGPEPDENDALIDQLNTHGLILPIQLPRNDAEVEEQQPPTFEEAAEYRAWRTQANQFFGERDRYMQSRIFREGVRDNRLLHATHELMAFWAKMMV